MLLPRDEAELVFRLHSALMLFVNQQLQAVSGPDLPSDYSGFSNQQRFHVVQAFLGRLDLIDAFVAANPAGLAADELEIVSSWRLLVAGRFIALRQLRSQMVLLSCRGPATAYGVLGLSQPLDTVIPTPMPAMIETVLLPFRGKITYDGIVNGFPVMFGPGSRRGFEEMFREAKARNRFVTSLPWPPPASGPLPGQRLREAKPRPARSGRSVPGRRGSPPPSW